MIIEPITNTWGAVKPTRESTLFPTSILALTHNATFSTNAAKLSDLSRNRKDFGISQIDIIFSS